jgi:hypothetical protein
MESGAVIHRGFGPDPSAMPVDNPLHDCQAYAGPFVILRAVQPLKHAE